ncbi:hypothetical protein B0H10DRAFT_644679 [Mycena sp. CBHHK59/15]|nr:hypothetical protein B0H10DRAFT_644679 [Mycena sp. CBHHK59/15]
MAGPTRTTSQQKTVQPPRPPNAWILYRADKAKVVGRLAQSEMSKQISIMWKSEPPHVRAEYERRADEKKAEHSRMYPDYRFQPVKKEEKDRLREVRKQEKEKRKESQRRGRAKPPPAAPAPQASRYAPSSILDPLAPYYQAEQRYGAAGPSPPLSAAASPSDSGFSELPQSRVEESSTSPSAHASPYPQTPSSVYGSPGLPPTSYGVSFSTGSQSPETPSYPSDLSHINASEVNQWNQPQGEQGPSLVTTHNNWSSGMPGPEQSRSQELVSFTLSTPQMNPMQSWTGQNTSEFDHSFQAILSATGDPSIFQISNFDPQSLLEHPTGQLEVSLGQLSFPGFDDANPIPDITDLGFYIPDSFRSYGNDVPANEYGSGMELLFPAIEPAPNQDFGAVYNADDFLNFDDTSDARPAPSSEQPTSQTSRPYVPPSGAAHSSTRRVGASWKPPITSGSPVDQSATRPSWSVHA